VEGYTDVLRLHQEGFGNAVASSGTALTLRQARTLVRYCSTVTVLMDGDEPGVQAARRAVGELLAAGADVRVVLLPEGHDPDSYLQAEGAKTLAERLEQSQDFLEFELSLAGSPREMRAEQRLTLARSVAAHLARIPDALKLDVLTREAARVIGVGREALVSEVERLQKEAGTAAPPSAASAGRGGGGDVQAGRPGELERELVRAMLMSAEARSQLGPELKRSDIADPALSLVFSEVLAFSRESPQIPVSEFLTRLPEPGIQSLVVALHQDSAPLEETAQLLSKLRARRARSDIRRLKARLATTSSEDRPRLLKLIQLSTRLISAPADDREQLLAEIEQLKKHISRK
jgi:DNA primase